MKFLLYSLLLITTLAGFAFQERPQKDNQLTKKEKKQGWVLLFDGKTMDQWKGYRDQKAAGWEVVNGELVCREGNISGRSDLVSLDTYENFELKIDWKIAPEHNSGIIYLSDGKTGASYESGPEYQLIDDMGYPEKLKNTQLSGSNYDMNPPTIEVARKAGEYNQTRILVNKGHVEHWLNGARVVEYEMGSEQWKKDKANSKWKDLATYGATKNGYIALQDHGGGVWFKNIKIRRL